MKNKIKSKRFTITPELVLCNLKISDKAIRLYGILYLYGFDNDVQNICISNKELAKRLGCKVRTVQLCLKQLEEQKAIKMDCRTRAYNNNPNTIRTITLN